MSEKEGEAGFTRTVIASHTPSALSGSRGQPSNHSIQTSLREISDYVGGQGCGISKVALKMDRSQEPVFDIERG